ncbi:hypothetical protein DFJ73DRAFT_857094 [Zopfochytrium polystomum]|nr:hypothetical protein DFJ73DRAFT_857094 [Zopfochytrium polystomum]
MTLQVEVRLLLDHSTSAARENVLPGVPVWSYVEKSAPPRKLESAGDGSGDASPACTSRGLLHTVYRTWDGRLLWMRESSVKASFRVDLSVASDPIKVVGCCLRRIAHPRNGSHLMREATDKEFHGGWNATIHSHDETRRFSLIILQSTQITTIMDDGTHWKLEYLQRQRNAWPLKEGVLIEQGDAHEEGVTYIVLSHPLMPMQQLQFMDSNNSPSLKVVGSKPEEDLIFTFNHHELIVQAWMPLRKGDPLQAIASLQASCVWRAAVSSTIDEVFLSYTAWQSVVWARSSSAGRLSGFRFDRTQNGFTDRIYYVPACSAIPIYATSDVFDDVLIMAEDGKLSLFSDGVTLLHCHLSESSATSAIPWEFSPIQGPSSESPYLLYRSGSIGRASFDFKVSDGLVELSLDLLSSVMPTSAFTELKGLLLRTRYERPPAQTLSEWECFATAFLCLGGGSDLGLVRLNSSGPHQKSLRRVLGKYRRLRSRDEAAFPVLRMSNSQYSRGDLQQKQWIRPAFLALHLLYESLKLNTTVVHFRVRLGIFLLQLAKLLTEVEFVEFYLHDGLKEFHFEDEPNAKIAPSIFEFHRPFSIYKWLSRCFSGSPDSTPFIAVSNAAVGLRRANLIFLLFQRLTDLNLAKPTDVVSVLQLVDSNLLATLPFGVSMPLRWLILQCKNFDETILANATLCRLLGRDDLTASHEPFSPRESLSDRDVTKQEWAEIFEGPHRPVLESREESRHRHNDVSFSRFSSDDRLDVVNRVLVPSGVPHLAASIHPEHSEEAIAIEHQKTLLYYSNRLFALAIGCGPFLINTEPIWLRESMESDGFAVAAKMPPANQVVQLDFSQFEANYMEWPSFHRGVALALKVSSGSRTISGSWIVQNSPQTPSAMHGGFLLGLGLNGHLRHLKAWQFFDFLQGHSMRMIGTLLGLGCSFFASSDERASNCVSLHIPQCRRRANVGEYSPFVHTTAVLAIGMLHFGTSSRRYCDLVMQELLTAGNANQSIYSSGQHRASREGHALAAGLSLGMMAVGSGGASLDPKVMDQLKAIVSAGSKRLGSKREVEHSPNVVAPGAILAFSLIFLRTGDSLAAKCLAPPETPFELDFARPDVILLRTFGRNLILWESVLASKDWIKSHFPPFMRPSAATVQDLLVESGGLTLERESELHLRLNIVAGCCLAIGMKYAGSADRAVYSLLMEILEGCQRYSSQGGIHAERLTHSIAKNCFDVVVVAIATVMAGSGDENFLKYLHTLCERCGPDVVYGNHMASHLALGLTFLGAGTLTLGNSNKAIVGLVCALYPKFPLTAADNNCHLQAMRHFWVLAVEPRSIITRDVDTFEVCKVPISFTAQGASKSENDWTPYNLPNRKIAQVQLQTDRYWPRKIEIDLEQEEMTRPIVIFVKRKVGHLSYEKDPKGNLGLFSRTSSSFFKSSSDANASDLRIKFLIESFCSDPHILAFTSDFCQMSSRGRSIDEGFPLFSLNAMTRCLVDGCPEHIPVYLCLYWLVENAWSGLDPEAVSNFLLVMDLNRSQLGLPRSQNEASQSRFAFSDMFLHTCLAKLETLISVLRGDIPEAIASRKTIEVSGDLLLAPTIRAISSRSSHIKATVQSTAGAMEAFARRDVDALTVLPFELLQLAGAATRFIV